MGADGLLPLGSLPHVVSAVGTGQGARERQARFLRFVKSELDARRADAARRKPLFIVLDGFATLRDEFSDAVSMDLLANFYRVYADGPAVGIHCVVSTSRAKNIPSQILDASLQTWFFQLSDVHDYSSHGIRGTNVPAAFLGVVLTRSVCVRCRWLLPLLAWRRLSLWFVSASRRLLLSVM